MNRIHFVLIPLLFIGLQSAAQLDNVEEKSKFKSRIGIGLNAGYQAMKMDFVNDFFEKNANNADIVDNFPAINGGLTISGSLNIHWLETKKLITSFTAGFSQASSIGQIRDTTGQARLIQFEFRPVDLSFGVSASYKLIDAKRFNFQIGAGAFYHIGILLQRTIINEEAFEYTSPSGSNLGVMADTKIELYLVKRISLVAAAGYQYVVIRELKYQDGTYLGDGHVELDFSGMNITGGVRLYLF